MKEIEMYEQTRRCSQCGNSERREIDKFTAAFESTRVWLTPCPKCNSTTFDAFSFGLPPLDEELLKHWARSEDLEFMDQDEDIMMADSPNFELFKRLVKDKSLPMVKRGILLATLCIQLFDHTPEDTSDLDKIDLILAVQVKDFLVAHKYLFEEIEAEPVADYVMEVVGPLIGLT